MNFRENPYQSPAHTQANDFPKTHASIALIIWLATLSFWFGLVLAILGSAISFYPGSEFYWFLPTGLLIAPGIFLPKRLYRIIAIIACVICFLYAYSGYHRGIDYQHRLQNWTMQNSTHGSAPKN